MAITKSAKKAIRVAQRRRVFNIRRTRAMKAAVKEARSGTAEKLSAAYQAIDKAAKRGIIKKNAASRAKSRLSKRVAPKK